MRARSALGRAVIPTLVGLAACDAGPEAPHVEVTDLGLAGRAILGGGDLWLVLLAESDRGPRDANGDGDTEDETIAVVDLARNLLLEPGLAVDADHAAPLLAVRAGVAAFAVDEAAQGGTDLNGDGDALDRVLFVYDPSTGSVRSLGLAVSSLEVGGALIAFGVDEAGEGRDLDADGDSDGSVLHVYDLRTGATTALSLRDSVPLRVEDDRVALLVSEREGLDLTFDGDDQDRRVLEIYDARTHLLQNTTLALASTAVSAAGRTFGFSVSERDTGRGDLSGDGDEEDDVFFVLDPLRSFSANLGISIPLQPAPETEGQRYLLQAREEVAGLDLNGDGDLGDTVVQVFDAETGVLRTTGLASAGSALLVGDQVVVSVSEAMQGNTDLDGDGEAAGNVVHVFDPATGALENLGLDAFLLVGGADGVFLAASEERARRDWNQDGDQLDRVLFEWSPRSGLRASRQAVAHLLQAQAGSVLFSSSEVDLGRDANLDGDRDDLVLLLYSGASGRTTGFGLAAGNAARLTGSRSALVLVDERAQGRDLDGDGDLLDQVLHRVSVR